MREIGISPRFSRDKFVPLQTKQRYSTRDISGEVSLTLFFRGFVPFLSLADFVSRNKNLQVADLQRLKSCFGELVTATTSNHQNGPWVPVNVASQRNSLVWNITSSISSSKRWMPKSESMSSPMPLCCCLIIHWGLLPFHYRQYAVRFQFLVDEHPPFLRPLGAHHRFSAF